MTWMDSYYRVLSLTYRWVHSDDDMIAWADDAMDPLEYTPDLSAVLWAVSALEVIASSSAPSGVAPRIYRWARWAIATRIWRVIDNMMDAECPQNMCLALHTGGPDFGVSQRG